MCFKDTIRWVKMGNKNDINNALGIIGSPRKGGNTESLVDEVFNGMQESGVKVDKIFLNQLNIKPCKACDVCLKKGKCVQKDDMQNILEKIKQNNTIVLGTPLYFWGPTAQFKAFIDRFYGARKALEGKNIIIVIPFGDTEVKDTCYLTGMLKETLRFLKANITDIIYAPGVFEKGKIFELPHILETARNAGRKAVQCNTTNYRSS
jgi:multimeric flavodoxin WrbA